MTDINHIDFYHSNP